MIPQGRDRYVIVAIFMLTLFIFLRAPVRQVVDSNYSMLLSHSLITHGSFKLDHYNIPQLKPDEMSGITDTGYPYELEVVDTSLYYTFPPGSSVLSVPFVAAFNLLGISPVNEDGSYRPRGEAKIEKILAALLMAGLTVIIYMTARLILPHGLSLIVSLGGAFGTQVMSTASRALWSDTWGIFLFGIIVYLLVRQESQGKPVNPILLGTLLSWTYFIKPTYIAGIIPVSFFILIYYRPLFVRLVLTGLSWLAGFLIYSWIHFGKLLPSYYSSSRLSFDAFWVALAGNLVSPSRGFLVFCPFLLFVGYLLFRYRRNLEMSTLLRLGICVCVLHLIITSSFPHWWGGHSYGPRLMTGILPWIILLSIIALKAMANSWRRSTTELRGPRFILSAADKLKIIAGGVVLAASIFMNVNGALSRQAWLWNAIPDNVDQNTSRLWSWTYPQFLAAFLPVPRHHSNSP